jgi:hypothetical protein
MTFSNLQQNPRLRRSLDLIGTKAAKLHSNTLHSLNCVRAFTREGEKIHSINSGLKTGGRWVHEYSEDLNPKVPGSYRFDRSEVPWHENMSWAKLTSFVENKHVRIFIWGLLPSGRWVYGVYHVVLKRNSDTRVYEEVKLIELHYTTPCGIFTQIPFLTIESFLAQLDAWLESTEKEDRSRLDETCITRHELKQLRELPCRVLVATTKEQVFAASRECSNALPNLLGYPVKVFTTSVDWNDPPADVVRNILVGKGQYHCELVVVWNPPDYGPMLGFLNKYRTDDSPLYSIEYRSPA